MRNALIVLMLTVLVSCSYLHKNKQKIITGHENKNAWWVEFKDPKIQELVDLIENKNYDILILKHKIKELEYLHKASRAYIFPKIQISGNISRSKQTIINPLTGSTSSQIDNLYSINMVPSYELDIWGRNYHKTRAAYLSMLSTKEWLFYIKNSIISEAVRAYILGRYTNAKICIVEKELKLLKEKLKLVRERYKYAQANYMTILLIKENIDSLKNRLEDLRKNIRDLEINIYKLTGGTEFNIPKYCGANYHKNLPPIKSNLPSSIIKRRPDVISAEIRMKAAEHEFKAQRAVRFPNITLTASGGYTSTQLKDLFKPDSLLWQIAMGITYQLFDGGQLKNLQEAARERYIQANIEYAQTLINAFGEVMLCLNEREILQKQKLNILNYVRNVEREYKSLMRRYKEGLTDYLQILDIKLKMLNAQEILTDINMAYVLNRIAFYRAVGGKI